jgi:hypothetical protein
MHPRMMLRALAIVSVLAAPAAAQPSETPPPVAPAAAPANQKLVGVGYKAGNGVGFLGADLVIDPIPHLGFELQGSMFPMSANNESSMGYAVAPELRGYLFAGPRSTPYVSVGAVYAHITLGTATASATGTFANIGYEWRWGVGLGLHLGAGVGYLTKAEAMDGPNTVTLGGKVNPNIELGLRYMFL